MSWDRQVYEELSQNGITAEESAPALADSANQVTTGSTEIHNVSNPSAEIVNLYDNDTLVFVVLPQTSLSFNVPVKVNNGLKVKNQGLAASNFYLTYIED